MKLKYFKGKVSKGFTAIFLTRITLRISVGLLGMFLPIFLYAFFGENIRLVLAYYFIGFLLYAIVVGWTSQYLNKIGLRYSLRISVVIGALYYFLLYLLDVNFRDDVWVLGANMATFLLLSIILTQLVQRALYWVPLNTDMAKFTSKTNRGKQLALLESITLVLGAVMPLVAGALLTFYDYNVLFAIAVAVYLVALIPLLHLPRAREKFTWDYKKTWQEFLSKKRRGVMLAYMGDGAENVVGKIIWPIFIYELLEGNFFEIGALSSLIVIITITLQLMVGSNADKGGRRKMLRWGTSMYAVGWLIKIFIATAFQIFIASTFHNLMKIFARTPFDALSFEQASNEGHFVDEYTALHEMAINFGKSLMLLLTFVLVGYFTIEWTFILAAIASLAMNFITLKYHEETGRKEM